MKANEKISIVRNATVDAILGGKMVEKARVRHADGRVEELPCAGVFAYIGLEPNSGFLPASSRAQTKAVSSAPTTRSRRALPGVSAIGAVRSGYGGTLTDAIDEAQHVASAVRARLR